MISSAHVSIVIQNAVRFCDFFATSALSTFSKSSRVNGWQGQNVSFCLSNFTLQCCRVSGQWFPLLELTSDDSFRQVFEVSLQSSTCRRCSADACINEPTSSDGRRSPESWALFLSHYIQYKADNGSRSLYKDLGLVKVSCRSCHSSRVTYWLTTTRFD